MVSKLSFLAGLGAGYVLGAKAGRERYNQITSKARDLWQEPAVQEKVGQAQDVAKEKAEEAQHLAKEKAHEAQEAVQSKIGSDSGLDEAPKPAPPPGSAFGGSAHPDPATSLDGGPGGALAVTCDGRRRWDHRRCRGGRGPGLASQEGRCPSQLVAALMLGVRERADVVLPSR